MILRYFILHFVAKVILNFYFVFFENKRINCCLYTFSLIKERKKIFYREDTASILIVDVLISANPSPICRAHERRKRDGVNAVNYRKDVLINLLSLDQGLCSNARLKRHGLLLRGTHTAIVRAARSVAERASMRECERAGGSLARL